MKKLLLPLVFLVLSAPSAQAASAFEFPAGYKTPDAPRPRAVDLPAYLRGLYVSLATGATLTRDSAVTSTAPATTADGIYDNTATFAGAIGKRLNACLRAEVEVSYRKADVKLKPAIAPGVTIPGKNTSWTALANVYYDFLPASFVSPYVGAGAGAARHTAAITGGGFNVDDTDNTFAWQLGGGLRFNMTRNIDATLGYRYLGTGDMKFKTVRADYGGNEIRLGLTYSFGS